MVIVLTGVAGSGKTTIGTALARRLAFAFVDADDYHPPANVERMRAGLPLDDEARRPWLEAIRRDVEQWLGSSRDVVLACSALKASHVEVLRVDERVRFVRLVAPRAVLERRVRERVGHFFPATLVDTQLAALEDVEGALGIDAAGEVDEVVAAICAALGPGAGK